jgi:hypothetical protein
MTDNGTPPTLPRHPTLEEFPLDTDMKTATSEFRDAQGAKSRLQSICLP